MRSKRTLAFAGASAMAVALVVAAANSRAEAQQTYNGFKIHSTGECGDSWIKNCEKPPKPTQIDVDP